MDFLEGMLQKDKDEFSRVCNRLLSSCFLCKANVSNRADYYFVLRHKEKFDEYFRVSGYRLEINEDYGVVQLTNPHNYNRLHLKLYESIILLILRILYDEKKRELSISDEVIVTAGDIHDKFISLRIRDKVIDKTVFRNTVSTLRRFNLLETLDKDLSDEDARIIIFDSILMAVRVENIEKAYTKLMNYRKGSKEGADANEEINESEADQLA